MNTDSVLSGSYRPETGFGGLGAELARLEAQVNLSWAEESRLLSHIGLANSMSVLEIGSGPGFFTERLLSLLPDSRITAVEVCPDLMAFARARISSSRVEFVRTSLFDTGLADGSFDVAIARLVFQHLEDPVEGARAVRRLLKPNGKLAIIDIDAALWGIVQPCMPELESIYRKATRLQVQRGGDRLIGRRLWGILKTAGYASPQLDAFVYHSAQVGLQAFDAHLNPDRLLPAVEAGLVSIEEYTKAIMAYNSFRSAPEAYILMVGLLAHGTRPAA